MDFGYLLVLKGAAGQMAPHGSDLHYRGVCRLTAGDRASGAAGNDSSLWRLWLEEAEAHPDNEWWAFHMDRAVAEGFARRYGAHGLACEVLEVRRCDTADAASRARQQIGFLGFDVASLTLESLLIPESWFPDPAPHPLRVWQPVWRLHAKVIEDHRNANGLINDFDVAVLVRDAHSALLDLGNQAAPGSFDEVNYEVLAVHEAGGAGA